MPSNTLTPAAIKEAETRLVNYQRSLTSDPKKIRRNKWRTGPNIDPETQVFEGILGAGAFGSVYLVHNTSTDTRYAVKIQTETIDQRFSRNKRGVPLPTRPADWDPLGHTPPLTPSSEATIHSPAQVAARSLHAKRYRENRTYLQYIKSGHPNVCALEAFLDFESQIGDPGERGLVMFATYYEYCDAGDLGGVIDHYARSFRQLDRIVKKNASATSRNWFRSLRGAPQQPLSTVPIARHPPELFIWHIFSQLLSAVAFLHNEHPEYKDSAEHKNRAFITTADLAPANVFLQWPKGTNKRRWYPDVKVGDFGGACFLPKGGSLAMNTDELSFVWADPPEDDTYDGKTDVWSVGVMMYMLGKRGVQPTIREEGVDEKGMKRGESDEQRREREARQRKNPDRVGNLAGIYSETLNKAVKAALRIDKNKRPSSGAMYTNIHNSYLRRQPLMFSELPQWLQNGNKAIKHKFPPDRISDLVAGEWEKERKLEVEEAQQEEEEQDEDFALMLVEKDRKLRFGYELQEWEQGDDENHSKWLGELVKERPDLYQRLLKEARANVPSP